MSYVAGQRVLGDKTKKERKAEGQYLTPPAVARFMGEHLGNVCAGEIILEPALGSGTLAAAVIERAAARGYPPRFRLVGFETDLTLFEVAQGRLEAAAQRAAERGITVELDLRQEDFILAHLTGGAPTLFREAAFQEVGSGDGAFPKRTSSDRVGGGDGESQRGGAAPTDVHYDRVIANPPYFKLKPGDPRREAAENFSATSNVYAVFMELAARLLRPGGQAAFIVPRSFCSGAYFGKFRRFMTRHVIPEHMHLFESRQDAFRGDEVLQENLIFTFRRGTGGERLPDPDRSVVISTSEGTEGLGALHRLQAFPLARILGGTPARPVFRLPTGELDGLIIEAVDAWPGSLREHGIEVSTGPVVPFRSREALCKEIRLGETVPLLWLHNVCPFQVNLEARRAGKAPAISLEDGAADLVPATNYVLMRRFTAKEEVRRMVAAPFLVEGFGHAQVGFENHLNYLYCTADADGEGDESGGLSAEEACGLAALLGSPLLDRYMRLVSGHTQVNAGDLRVLPLPPLEAIQAIGARLSPEAKTVGAGANEAGSARVNHEQAGHVVFDVLREHGLLPDTIPYFSETRFSVEKIQEAQDVLKTLGLPRRQQSEMAALTLLILAQLSPETPWSKAQRQSLGITEIMDEMAARYGRQYAPNTRETVRRQVMHQFVDAVVAVKNPDDPTLPTNSPNTHYGLSDAAIRTIRKYGSTEWDEAAKLFLEGQRALIQRHRRRLEKERVPLRLASGKEYSLSPGVHNELQAAIINAFGPEFAPGAKVLYVGDTEDKTLHVETEALETLGFELTQHDKLPDVVLYDEKQGRLFLIEAVTSHGPVTLTRLSHLEQMLSGESGQEAEGSSVGLERIYVSAFPDFATFKNFLMEIAWETEVWLADTPEHMIHFNGDRFLK